MHRPDAGAHGDRATGQPQLPNPSLRRRDTTSEVQRGVGCQHCDEHGQRHESIVVGMYQRLICFIGFQQPSDRAACAGAFGYGCPLEADKYQPECLIMERASKMAACGHFPLDGHLTSEKRGTYLDAWSG
jgi:hypothetical protein